MSEREYELATLINSLQYDITKLKEELESKYREGYMDGKERVATFGFSPSPWMHFIGGNNDN